MTDDEAVAVGVSEENGVTAEVGVSRGIPLVARIERPFFAREASGVDSEAVGLNKEPDGVAGRHGAEVNGVSHDQSAAGAEKRGVGEHQGVVDA